MTDRAALVAAGWIECECGRTRRIPKSLEKLAVDLYVSGVIGPLMMPENPADHLCDPAWLREQVVALRATVAKRNQKIHEMGIGTARLKERGDRSVALPGPFRSKSQERRLAIQRAAQSPCVTCGKDKHDPYAHGYSAGGHDFQPPSAPGLDEVFEDARKSLEANPHLISSEGKSEIARLETTAAAPDVCRPFDHRADCVSLHCLEKTPVVKRSEVWDSVEKNAAEVSKWPEWRRIGSGLLPSSAPAAPSAPVEPIVCPCCEASPSAADDRDHHETECTCVEGCPNA